MEPSRSVFAPLLQALRFDGLWWRKFAYLGCVYGPEWWKRCSPPAIAAIIFALIGRNRRGAIDNLQRILGDPDRRRAAREALWMFAEFAHCMTETMEYYGPRPHAIRLDPPDHDPLAEALRERRGAVVVTGHFGNWDIAAKTLRDYDRPINIVMAREVNATTQAYVRTAREQVGVQVLYSDTSVFSSINMIRALRANEIVAIQLDRMLGPGGARLIPFFGAPAPFPSGPFVLARLAGAPVVPVFIPRLGTRHYEIRVGQRYRIGRDARDHHVLDRVMTEVVAEFEAIVREFPTQWFQFTPFWPAEAPMEAAVPAREDPAPRRQVVR
ncbi:MAG TPA: lysophospholipid acyltransferase family protein [Candidatus Binatia bacterium]|nr:lysophospholipid acyltransferase family protein [Candidatus Binatia bacterium]